MIASLDALAVTLSRTDRAPFDVLGITSNGAHSCAPGHSSVRYQTTDQPFVMLNVMGGQKAAAALR